MALIHVTSENFEKDIMQSEKTVLIDFWATWCGPCRMIAPIVEEIAEERDDITVAKIDVDEAGDLAGAFGITSIPTLVVMKNGEIVNKAVGYQGKQGILKML